jgi:hypothetical protein
LLGWCQWRRGDRDDAVRWTDRAQELFDQVSTPAGTAYLPGADGYCAVADVRLWSGDPKGAGELLGPLVVVAAAQGWNEALARASVVMGRCEAVLGRMGPAEARLVGACDVARSAGFPACELEARAALAALYRSLGRRREAESHVTAGRAIVETLSPRITDESIRHGFVVGALKALEEERP